MVPQNSFVAFAARDLSHGYPSFHCYKARKLCVTTCPALWRVPVKKGQLSVFILSAFLFLRPCRISVYHLHPCRARHRRIIPAALPMLCIWWTPVQQSSYCHQFVSFLGVTRLWQGPGTHHGCVHTLHPTHSHLGMAGSAHFTSLCFSFCKKFPRIYCTSVRYLHWYMHLRLHFPLIYAFV